MAKVENVNLVSMSDEDLDIVMRAIEEDKNRNRISVLQILIGATTGLLIALFIIL